LLTARKDDIGLPQSRLQAKAAKSSVYKWKVLKAVFAVQEEFGYLQQKSPMRLNPGKEKNHSVSRAHSIHRIYVLRFTFGFAIFMIVSH